MSGFTQSVGRHGVVLAALGVVLLWGTNFVFLKAIFDEFDVLPFLFVRYLGLLVLAWAVVAWQARRGTLAVRVARAATGRAPVIKFAGGYHGHADLLLTDAGSGVATLGLPASAGVTSGQTADTLSVQYNDLEAVQTVFAQVGEQIAAVIVEPVAGNMGLVLPQPDFLEGLRSVTQRNGALLIFDEVMTGFRVARGGAQERFNIQPDLTCLGKVVGGGRQGSAGTLEVPEVPQGVCPE